MKDRVSAVIALGAVVGMIVGLGMLVLDCGDRIGKAYQIVRPSPSAQLDGGR